MILCRSSGSMIAELRLDYIKLEPELEPQLEPEPEPELELALCPAPAPLTPRP